MKEESRAEKQIEPEKERKPATKAGFFAVADRVGPRRATSAPAREREQQGEQSSNESFMERDLWGLDRAG